MRVRHVHRCEDSRAFILLLQIFLIKLVKLYNIASLSAIHLREVPPDFKNVTVVFIL